jgi:putative oxidoreductase
MRELQGVLSALGRLLLCAILLMAAIANKIPHFSDVAGLMGKKGIPAPEVLLVGAIVFLIVGGVSVVVGYQARIGAVLLFVFLVLATYYFHDFWNVNKERVLAENKEAAVLSDDAIQKMVGREQVDQMNNFLKNLSMMGAMLFILANGAGRWSVDAYLARQPGTSPTT